MNNFFGYRLVSRYNSNSSVLLVGALQLKEGVPCTIRYLNFGKLLEERIKLNILNLLLFTVKKFPKRPLSGQSLSGETVPLKNGKREQNLRKIQQNSEKHICQLCLF